MMQPRSGTRDRNVRTTKNSGFRQKPEFFSRLRFLVGPELRVLREPGVLEISPFMREFNNTEIPCASLKSHSYSHQKHGPSQQSVSGRKDIR
jgi:hypothetical protein